MSVSKNIKKIRKSRGLTLEELAGRVNLTRGHLSKIENALRSPPVSTLQSLAVALGVDISELLEHASSGDSRSDSLDIVRREDKSEGNTVDIDTEEGYSYKSLVKNVKNKYMSPFLMTIEKGQTNVFSHDSEEFGYVVSGEFILEYQGEEYKFQTGDSFYFDSRKPHKMTNGREEPTVILAVNFNYRRF